MLRHQIIRVLISAFYLKYHLPKAALDDYLKILNIATRPTTLEKEMSSPHLFLKRFSHLKDGLKKGVFLFNLL